MRPNPFRNRTWCLVLLIGGLPACTSETVDERVAKLVGRESVRLGNEALAPPERTDDGVGITGSAEKHPSTSNLPASDLKFTPQDEARDVAARLKEYAKAVEGTEANPAMRLDLQGVFRVAQLHGREFQAQEEQYLLVAIRLLIEQHRWTPIPSDQVSALISGAGTDGTYENAVRVVNQLRVTQQLPYGGEAEAAWVWTASEQLRSDVTNQYRQSSEIVLSANIPLLRGAGLVAQESLIQSERDLIYAARDFERFRREYLVEIANDYFGLLQQIAQLENRRKSLDNLKTFAEETSALVQAGRRRQFDSNDAETSVLEAAQDLASQSERYILALDLFKVRLGLPVSQPIEIAPLALDLIEPQADLETSPAIALQYRLDLQNDRDRIEDARRNVANARNDLLPDLNLDGKVAIPTDSDTREGGLYFDPDDTAFSAGVTLSLPLDREQERLRVRQAVINLNRLIRDYDRSRDEVVVTVRSTIRELDLARFQLNLAERGVELSAKRIEEFQLNPGNFDTRRRLEAQTDLVNAENGRDTARRELRTAILRHLLETDQLRVARDGSLLPLAGMEDATVPGA